MKFLDKIGIAYLWDQIINYIRIVTETIDKNKQDKLEGKQKQVVTFDAAGTAKAEDISNITDVSFSGKIINCINSDTFMVTVPIYQYSLTIKNGTTFYINTNGYKVPKVSKIVINDLSRMDFIYPMGDISSDNTVLVCRAEEGVIYVIGELTNSQNAIETGSCELYIGQNNLAKSTYASYIKTNGYVHIFGSWNNVLCGSGAGAGFFKGLPFPVGSKAENISIPDMVPIIGTMVLSGTTPRPIKVKIGQTEGTFDCEWPAYISGFAYISYPVN